MKYASPLSDAILRRRYKRFLADIVLPDGSEHTAHCANPGAMTSCWEPDCAARVRYDGNPKRKLAWSLEQTQVDGAWIIVNTALHNKIVGEALDAGAVPELAGYSTVAREQRYGENSRADFLLSGHRSDSRPCWVEVKGVTLVHQGRGMFPDAVTKRGQKHLLELGARVEQGDRAVLLFCVGREDIDSVAPADHVDPEYGRLLREAARIGVEVMAHRCRIGPTEVVLGGPVPVLI